MFERVLLGLDDSESGQLAISYVTALARNHGAEVHVLHVNQFIVGGRGYTVGTAQEATSLVADAVVRLQDAGIRAGGSVLNATCVRVAAGIAEKAEAVDADVVLLGSRRRHGLARLASGNIREKVIALTWLPVLTAPAPLAGVPRGRLLQTLA